MMSRPNILLSLTLIFVFSGLGSLFGQYNFLHYSVNEGLSQSQVHCIIEDNYGKLWFGTQGGGVCIYDGVSFKRYNSRDGLPNDYINALLADDNKIWIGTRRGLGYHMDDQFYKITTASGVEPNIFSLALVDRKIYLGTSNGLLSYNLETHQLKPELETMFIDAQINSLITFGGSLWIGSSKGLGIINADTTRLYTQAQGLLSNNITCISPLSDQTMVVGNYNGGIQLFKDGKLIDLNHASTNHPKYPRSIYIKDLNTLWVGTQDRGIGILNLIDTTWQFISHDDGLTHNNIRTIYQDDWENIWVGTSGGGVSKYLGKQFIQYDKGNGLIDNYIYALETDADERLWFSTSNKGVSILDSNTVSWIGGIDTLLKNVTCKSILKDQHGVIWMGTEGQGIFASYGDSIWNHNSNDGLSNDFIRSMALDSNGTIWIGTVGGGINTIEKLDTLTYDIIKFLTGSGWSNTVVMDFHVDLRKRVWFCTEDGRIGLIGRDGISNIFSSKHQVPSVPLRSMIEDKAGRLIVATGGEGLIYSDLYSDSISFDYMDQQFFNSLNFYSLVLDDNGRIWAGTERGVDRLQLGENGSLIEHEHFGREQGFLGIENCQDASFKDPSGNLWFGTVNGLLKHTPSIQTEKSSKPKLTLHSVALFNQLLAVGNSHTDSFLYDQNNFSFSFEGVHLNKAREVRYQWRLVGYEDSWTPLKNAQFVNYPVLPAGDYRFEVSACVGDNNCSEIQSYSFFIKRPIWQKWWFYLLTATLFIVLIYVAYRSRVKSLQNKERQLAMENKLMSLEQKALQLQMNPHFLFNALNSIQGLISGGQNKEARKQMSHFAKLMRSILTNSKEDFLPLHQELIMLNQYIEMEQFCRGHSFTYKVHIGPEIDEEEIEIPSMIIQPFIENAIIHGMGNIDYPGALVLNFLIKGNILECHILDNGIGIDASKKIKGKNNNHTSLGMEVTSERLKLMSTNKELERVHITDLKTSGGQGTKVVINIPI